MEIGLHIFYFAYSKIPKRRGAGKTWVHKERENRLAKMVEILGRYWTNKEKGGLRDPIRHPSQYSLFKGLVALRHPLHRMDKADASYIFLSWISLLCAKKSSYPYSVCALRVITSLPLACLKKNSYWLRVSETSFYHGEKDVMLQGKPHHSTWEAEKQKRGGTRKYSPPQDILEDLLPPIRTYLPCSQSPNNSIVFTKQFIKSVLNLIK